MLTYSTFEANWEVGLVTAEAVHGIGFAMETALETAAEKPAGNTDHIGDAAD